MKLVAKTLIFDTDNHVLVLTRSGTHPRHPHHLDFPGGLVEEEEKVQDAAAREIVEESGLQIDPDQLSVVFQKNVKDFKHFVLVGRITSASPPIEISWEHSEYQWMSIPELLKVPLPSGVDDYFLTVLEYLRDTTSRS